MRTLCQGNDSITFCDINMGGPRESHYQNTNAFIFVYDQSNTEASFLEMLDCIKDVVSLGGKERLTQIPHCVVLTKTDLPASMTHDELLQKYPLGPKHIWLSHTTSGMDDDVNSLVEGLLSRMKSNSFSFPKWVPTREQIDWARRHCGPTGPL